MGFSADLREKLLLWCDRHCCLCKKACDIFIEVHHLVPEKDGGTDDEDNAIPLCFDCHGRVSHYDANQPIGTKFKVEELKKRREQVYEQFTRSLVPGLEYRLTQALTSGGKRKLPDVGFSVIHTGDAPWIHLLVNLEIYADRKIARPKAFDPMYGGKVQWNLNPKAGVHGHFTLPLDSYSPQTDLRVGINITIIDRYERSHRLLPVTWVYSGEIEDWWLDPVDPTVGLRRDEPRLGG